MTDNTNESIPILETDDWRKQDQILHWSNVSSSVCSFTVNKYCLHTTV